MPLEVVENVPLAPLTTLQVGGPARYFATANVEHDVPQALEFAEAKGIDVFVLGGGSNILVADSGFDGLVLQIALKGIRTEEARNSSLNVTSQAGEDWDAFVNYCVLNNYAGIECLSGIPGYVGGTPVQNVGAYGQEVSETIVSVRCFDRQTREFFVLANKDCGFEYRKSIFNSTLPDRYIVLSVVFELKRNGSPKVVYKDLQDFFGGREATLGEVRDAVLKIRRSKSMVIDPGDPNSRSAGSFFKNPIVPETVLPHIAEKSMIQNVPHFRVNKSEVKIPAAWLIERSGFQKGFVHGKAGISSNHTLAFINRGGATAKDIISLKDLIQDAVQERFQIQLVPEPVFIGFGVG